MSTTYQGSKKQLPGVPKLHVQVNNHLSQSVVVNLDMGSFQQTLQQT